ncbi:MAG: 2-hydroxyacyl-CoA dehydratase family protein [Bacteroidales bacterium]|nr:2-hydroxyacyl-CoA dehydratase family protein [Bacteroidales bacterium]
MNDLEILSQLNTEANDYFKALTLYGVNESARKGLPFILASDDALPEIPIAMNFSLSILTVAGAMGTGGPLAANNIDKATELGVENRLCASVKMAAYYLLSGTLPKPDMFITTNSPCDAVDMLGQFMDKYKPWSDVPRFRLDSPHGTDPSDFDYFGKQLRECTREISKVTGCKFDMQRFLEVSRESNYQAFLVHEFQEMKRAIPCPVDPDMARKGWELARWVAPTDPSVFSKATDWLERLVRVTEQRVKDKRGIDGINEKIRFLWYDVQPSWGSKLFPRLQKELGAVCLMNYYSYSNMIPIDMSNEEAIMSSIAKKYLLGTPMTRQAMHSSDIYCGDILRICKDFKCDAMIMPCHVGHRDTNAYHKMAKDICAENGIPFLFLGCDVWDERYMTPDTVFDRIKTFFEISGLL